MTPSRSVATRAVVVLAMAVWAGAAACDTVATDRPAQLTSVPADTPTAAPRWQAGYAALTTDSARNRFLRDSMVVYGRALEFDTVDGAGDEQHLPVDSARSWPGPLVRIEPQRTIHALSDSLLATGRIVARILNRSADSTYTPLQLAPGDTAYWWVEQRGGSAWVSAFVRTSAPAGGVLVAGLQRTSHGAHRWLQPTARWIAPPTYDGQPAVFMFGFAPWSGCTGSVCCEGGTTLAGAVTFF